MKNIVQTFLSIEYIKKVVLIFPLVIFLFLLARNPFSERTLIPNFEPFPDSFHYVTTSRCFIDGQGWNLCREGRVIPSAVPPLYGSFLLPFFLLHNDPRMFYVANVALCLSAYMLLLVILKKLRVPFLGIVLVLLLYILNFYSYWFPTLAMAEQLLIPLFLSAILIFISPVTKRNSVFAGLLAVSFYATKYAAAPLVVVYGFAYLLKIVSSDSGKRKGYLSILQIPNKVIEKRVELLLYLSTGLIVTFIIIGPQFVESLIGFLSAIQPGVQQSASNVSTNYFSSINFSKNIWSYLSILWSKPVSFLWQTTPLIPVWVGIPGIAGLFLGFKKATYRLLSGAIITMGLAQIMFMSTFYVVDARYVYTLFPSVLIGVGLLISLLAKRFSKPMNVTSTNNLLGKYLTVSNIILVVLIGLLLFTHLKPLKSQIGLNLKYAETPWWYIAVKEVNSYFLSLPTREDNQQYVLITAIPPYLMDYYSNGMYQLLPLSYDHDFRKMRNELFGENNYSDLIVLYSKYIDGGREVYLTNYGLGNEIPRHEDFEKIQAAFKLELVQTGCHDLCNIWKVSR